MVSTGPYLPALSVTKGMIQLSPMLLRQGIETADFISRFSLGVFQMGDLYILQKFLPCK